MNLKECFVKRLFVNIFYVFFAAHLSNRSDKAEFNMTVG